MDNWRKIPWLSVGAAKEEIGTLTTALDSQTDPRNRIKTARRLAYAGSSIAFSEDPLDVATIDVALAALRRARKHGAVTDDLNRSMAWLSKIRLDVTGCADFQVLAEKKKRVPVETACLAASGHENLDSEIWVGDSDVVLEAMNRGDFFLVSVRYDGLFAVTLRIIDAPDPVLKSSEYRHLEYSTDVGFLKIENSELRCGAPEDMENAACVTVQNGLFKVQLHHLQARSDKYVLVACETETNEEPLETVPELE